MGSKETRRAFLHQVGAGAAALACGAFVGCSDDSAGGADAAPEPDARSADDGWAHDVTELGAADAQSTASYFQSRFSLSLSSVYWGDLHTHSLYSYDTVACQAQNGPEESLQYARDPQQGDLDFVALTDHAEMPPEKRLPPQDADLWHSLLRISREQTNEDPAKGRVFIVFPGWEYTNTHGLEPVFGSANGYGHKCVILKDPDNVPSTRAASWWKGSGSDELARTAAALWKHLAAHRPNGPLGEGTALTIPHTTSMAGGADAVGDDGHLDTADHQTDWSAMDKDFVRNVEIYSKWGSSEGPAPAGASCQQADTASLLDYESDEHDETKTLRVLLYNRWNKQGDPRFCLSFVGGTDNHKGEPGNAEEKSCGTEMMMQYRGSVTGIAAPSLSRASLWTGLWNRHTLAATTGPSRLALLVAAEAGGQHALMGERVKHDGTVRLRALADEGTEELEVILDGCLHQTIPGSSADLEIALPAGRHYIYVRAIKQDAGSLRSQSWSSPIYFSSKG